MGKMIAIGGGYNGGDFDKQLEEKIRSFIPKENPIVIFVPYASTDYIENYNEFKQIYNFLGCEVNMLQPGKENVLLQADLIYFGRGSTIQLLKELHETNSISFLHQAIDNGTILAGFSAGAHALFTVAGSNEGELGYTLVEGLGFIDGCIISHYNYLDRAEAFHNMLTERRINGIGLEDHTMMVVENDIATLYSSKLEPNGYLIQSQDPNLLIRPIKGEKITIPF
jgi:dipeptidase E